MNKKIFIIGGDLRQVNVANMLSDYQYKVSVFGFGKNMDFAKGVKVEKTLENGLSDADIIVLPLPCCVDNETVNMPMSDDVVLISELFKAVNKNQIIVAGMVSEKIAELAKIYNIYIADYFKREELEISNAIPTVEGAIQIAMEETPFTIHNSRCLVVGYGRIGRLLCAALKSLGADVTVSARKCSDFAWINAFSYHCVHTSQLEKAISDMDIVFNTVPHPVLDKTVLEKVSPDCLIIDLASKPGGVDFEAASMLGRKVIWALSLPGKVAPVTAGKMITETIINLLEELGV
ncbi:MAG: Dipicolinate synthase subunit A [Firmicutes bacterium ADurb.Bin193]|nr:MAG: Dipicolinate synthase subunit A [Firmicutes bacterium ADurb.Bin193]